VCCIASSTWNLAEECVSALSKVIHSLRITVNFQSQFRISTPSHRALSSSSTWRSSTFFWWCVHAYRLLFPLPYKCDVAHAHKVPPPHADCSHVDVIRTLISLPTVTRRIVWSEILCRYPQKKQGDRAILTAISNILCPILKLKICNWQRRSLRDIRSNAGRAGSNPARNMNVRGYIQKFPNWVDKEISTTINTVEKQHKGLWRQNSLDSFTNSNKTARSGREFCHLQFSLQVASPETFEHTLVFPCFFFMFCR
jgi:hypothetical protein